MDLSAGSLLGQSLSENILNLPQPEIRKWENFTIARDKGNWTWRNKYRPKNNKIE